MDTTREQRLSAELKMGVQCKVAFMAPGAAWCCQQSIGAAAPIENTHTVRCHVSASIAAPKQTMPFLPASPVDIAQTHTFVSTQHVEAGTASYMAPECFKGNQGLSEKVRLHAFLGWLLGRVLQRRQGPSIQLQGV